MNILIRAILISSFALAAGTAAAQQSQVTLNIQAQPMERALQAFAKQSGLQVIFPTALTEDLLAPSIEGAFTPQAALQLLLQNSDLSYEFVNDRTVAIRPVKSKTQAAMPKRETDIRMARVMNDATEDQQTPPPSPAKKREEPASSAGEVTVTGSRIKGVKDKFSPVIVTTREDMDMAGYRTVSDFFDDLPQNFGGGVTLDTAVANSVSGAGAAGINLRGLGNEATLILLNGRRLPAGGSVGATAGNFVDISAIPVSAIERIEVVTDGASAIYGSEAIAGVVNIITRKDFTGGESRLDYNMITDGGADTVKVGQTFGMGGTRAHGLITYEYSREEPLNAKDKPFTAAVSTDPTWLLPFSKKHSVTASSGFELSPKLSLAVDGYFNQRKSLSYNTRSYPSFFDAEGPNKNEQLGGAAALHIELGSGWESDASVSYSKSQFELSFYFPAAALRDGGGTRATNLLSEVSVGGPLFRITDDPVRLVMGVQRRDDSVQATSATSPSANTDQQRDVLATYAEIYAPLMKKVAMTFAARYEDYSDVGSSFDPKVGIAVTPLKGLNLRGSYQTSFRAPRLRSIIDIYGASLLRYQGAVALVLTGTRADIHPEQGENWSYGVDFTPEQIPGLRLSSNYFRIDYTERMGFPVTGVLDTTQGYSSFSGDPIFNPSAAQVQSLIAGARSVLDYSVYYPTLGTLTPAGVTVILDSRQQNLSSSKVSGMDFQVDYDLPVSTGTWSFAANATLLNTYTQQTTPNTPVDNLLNTYGNPIDMRLRGTVGWRTTPVSAQLSVNYIDNYRDNKATGGIYPVASWTTFDASVRLDLGALSRASLARGTFLSFNASNFLNKDPPRVGPRPIFGATDLYDTANADPVGRRIGLLLTKQW